MITSQSDSAPASRRPVSAILVFSGLTSLGAGVIHAAAVGIHADARQASLVFVAIAIFQIGWGVLVAAGPAPSLRLRAIALLGGLTNLGLVGGWWLASESGIGFIDGLEVGVGADVADSLAAILALSSSASALLYVLSFAVSPVAAVRRPVGVAGVAAVAVLVAAVTVPGLAAASSHSDHDHSAGGDDHADDDHAGDDHAGDDHADDDHADDDHADDDHHAGEVEASVSESASSASVSVEVCNPADPVPAVPDHVDAPGDEHSHGDADEPAEPEMVCEMVETSAYHPDLPIDLGGVAGVTPQQQAAAENLVAVTLLRLPQFADPDDAIAAGYYPFGDGVTGHEHFLNWDLVDDGRLLDPDYPESLVYATENGQRRLVSAMFMLDSDDTLATVPDVGGELMQWHVHQDLCMTTDAQPVLAGLRSIGAECGSGVGFPAIPMIHVWIEPNECGPFAALEGVGAGQVSAGEETLCDHAHG